MGLRAALKEGCGLVLLLNNDTEFDSDLLSRLSEALQEYQCEMVVPKISYFDDPRRIWCAGGYFSMLRATSKHFGYRERDHGQFDQPRAVSYGPTCCLLIRKEVFDRIGLMDATYFVYYDDTDFCLRAYRAGMRLFYVPAIRLLHKVSALTGHESPFAIRHLTRNHVYFILKSFPRWQALFYLAAYELHILGRYLLAPAKLRACVLREEAFLEGILLFHSRTKRFTARSTLRNLDDA
jgi:hypothetical protein